MNTENNEKILEMLKKINECITDETIENASPNELAQYYGMITKTMAKVKNLD